MRLRRVIWNPWQSNGKLRNMNNQSFEGLCHKQSGMQGGEAKRNLSWSIFWWHSCQPLFEYFQKSNLCMLYVVSKLRKSEIQCFKRCVIRSWNEGVTAIGIRSLQAEGQFRKATKSAFGCEMISQPSCSSAKFRSHFVHLRNSPECFQIFAIDIFWYFASDIWCLNPNSLLVIHQL